MLCVICFFLQTMPHAYAIPINDNAQNTTLDFTKSTEQKSAVFDLYLNNNNKNEIVAFDVNNMLPGDSIYQQYNVSVSCTGDVTVKFRANIKDKEKLSEVLNVKVILVDEDSVLYDGLMKDMPKSLNAKIKTNSRITKTLQYDIITYLDTSVGNEYMAKSVEIDFMWWVDETSKLDSPPTGDASNITMWRVVMVSSFVSVCFLITKRKRGD